MLEFALQTPSLKVVWRLFVRLSGRPNFQVLLADLIWRASLLTLQGALPGSFLLQGSFLDLLLFDRLSSGPNLQVLLADLIWRASLLNLQGALPGSFLLQGSFLGGLLPESCFLLCSLFYSLGIDRLLVGFFGISPGQDSSLPSRNLLPINNDLLQGSFFGPLLFDRGFLAQVLLPGLGFVGLLVGSLDGLL